MIQSVTSPVTIPLGHAGTTGFHSATRPCGHTWLQGQASAFHGVDCGAYLRSRTATPEPTAAASNAPSRVASAAPAVRASSR